VSLPHPLQEQLKFLLLAAEAQAAAVSEEAVAEEA
jgi:hypothetical protein